MVNARLGRQHAPIAVHAEELHPLDFLQPPAAFRHLGGPGGRHQDGRRGIGRGGDVQEETAALELPRGLDLAADAAAPVSRSGSFPGTPGTCRSHQYGGSRRGVKIRSFLRQSAGHWQVMLSFGGGCPVLPSRKSERREPVRTPVDCSLQGPSGGGRASHVLARCANPCSGVPRR